MGLFDKFLRKKKDSTSSGVMLITDTLGELIFTIQRGKGKKDERQDAKNIGMALLTTRVRCTDCPAEFELNDVMQYTEIPEGHMMVFTCPKCRTWHSIRLTE